MSIEETNLFNNDNQSSEIELTQLVQIIIRNKGKVAMFTIFGALIGLFFAFTIEKKWQGQLQIVLRNDQSSLLPGNQNVNRILGISSNANLKTEVGILRSPSILFNVFDFVKKNKLIKSPAAAEMNFNDWRKQSLDISLEKGTSILNLSYSDTDKELILEALNLISTAYQDYSDRDRINEIDRTIIYLNEQIKKFKIKSNEGFKNLQEFATEHNISNIQNKNQSIINIDVEDIRLKSLQELNEIKFQLEKINSLDKNDDQILYMVSLQKDREDLLKRFNFIDQKLANLKSWLKDDDATIENWIQKRKSLLAITKKNILGNLTTRKEFLEGRIKSVERPEGVLTKFQELIRIANGDKIVLEGLEEKLRLAELEKSRDEAPWSLITKPTLIPYAISPDKKLILASGILLGFIFGFIFSIFNEKKSNLLLNISYLKLFDAPIISEISIYEDSIDSSLDLLLKGYLFAKELNYGLLIDNDYLLDKFKIKLDLFKKDNIKISRELTDLDKSNILYLIALPGKTNKNYLINSFDKCSLYGKKIDGFMIFNFN